MAKQVLDASDKSRLLVLVLYGKRLQNALLVICLCLLPVFSSSALEAAPAPTTDVRPESVDGGEVADVRVDDDAAGWMLDVMREVEQSLLKGCDEFYALLDMACSLLPPESKPVRSDQREKDPDQGYECDGYCGLYLSLPLFLVAIWAGTVVQPSLSRGHAGATAEAWTSA